MTKRTTSLMMALVMMLSLLPISAFAAGRPDPAKFDSPIISDLVISEKENGEATLTFVLKNPDSIKDALGYYDINSSDGSIWDINAEVSIDDGEWKKISITNGSDFAEGVRETTRISELHVESYVKFRTYYTGWDVNGYYSGWYGDDMGKFSNVLTLNEKIDINASAWAIPELEKAEKLGLIPDALIGQDLTKPITRAEFAAVSVKTYEAIAGVKAADPTVENPFKDTTDKEVLKAYEIGITTGTGDGTTFSPNDLLNREQAATMLTRVYKKTSMNGWTMAKDSEFILEYTKPAPFSDDANISGWAKDSVYFMAANKIIQGSEGKFMPKATTDAEIAIGYAQATREQALLIAVRMVENLK